MFNWLGTWLGGWFGSGDPAPPGSMSGVASVSISTVATLTSTGSAPGMMSGTAALAISTTATITHATPVTTGNFWTDGFWSGGFWSDGFWGVFEQPYTQLKLGQQIFVFTELAKHYALSVSSQIIAFAEKHEVSVLTAMDSLNVCTQELRITAAPKRSVTSVDQPVTKSAGSSKAVNKKSLYATSNKPRIDIATGGNTLYVTQRNHALPVTVSLDRLTISTQHK